MAFMEFVLNLIIKCFYCDFICTYPYGLMCGAVQDSNRECKVLTYR